MHAFFVVKQYMNISFYNSKYKNIAAFIFHIMNDSLCIFFRIFPKKIQHNTARVRKVQFNTIQTEGEDELKIRFSDCVKKKSTVL